MNFRTVALSVVWLAALLEARDKTDVMVMKNGDRMTCAIKGLNSGVLYVDFDYIDGTASVDWTKVAHLESKQLFLVKTEDGSVYEGTLSTPEEGVGRPLKIQLLESAEKEAVIDRSQVVAMIGTSDKFWERFNGGIGFGFIYSKGNQSTQYSLSTDSSYVRERWSARTSFDSNLSSGTGVSVSTRNSFNFGALHLLPRNHWFYSGLGAFLQSSEQGITLQSTAGGGVGRYLINTDRARVGVLGGLAWQRTEYKQTTVGPNRQDLAAALIYTEAKLFRFSKTNFDATAALLPALSDPGRIRFNTNFSYYIKLVGNLKWNVSFYGNWDNRPPAGLSGSDYGTSSGLTWTYGLK
jgi:hypothetical protein